jgi:LuxR family maltose regulon positive regulatory protein
VWLDVLAGDFASVDLLSRDIFKGNKTVAGFISLIEGYRYFYQTGEFEKSIKMLKDCLQELPEEDVLVREMSELILGLSLRYSGDLASSGDYLKKISLGDDIPILTAISYADILLVTGKLSRALSFVDRIIDSGRERYGENLVPEYGYLYIMKGHILRERDDIGGALKACRKGLYLARNNEYVEIVFLGNLEYARILAADKNYADSERAMAVSIEAARASSAWAEFMSMAYKVRIEICKGNIGYAGELLEGMVDFSVTEVPYRQYFEYLSLCRYCLCKQETGRVHGITDAMIREDIPVKRAGRLIECYVLKAIAYYVELNMDQALETLGQAFLISEKEGQVRVYIDEGEPMQALFAEALKRGLLPDYLKKYVDGVKGGGRYPVGDDKRV